MSRSNQTELINPATRFFDWSGADGTVTYYDKDKKENVLVAQPFRFLVLDRVAQVTGGIDRNGSYEGFWSNAVRNTLNQAFVVRSKEGIEGRGLWQDIKNTPGMKFMTGLYIGFYDDAKELHIGYLRIKGAALNAWIEFANRKNIYEGAYGINGKVQCKKGTNTYFEPVFEHYPVVTDESDAKAKELDVTLQEYLTAYFAKTDAEPEVTETKGEKALAVNSSGAYYDNPPEDRPFETPTDDEKPEDLDEIMPF